MNREKRKKLGIRQNEGHKEAVIQTKKLQQEITSNTPISLDESIKDFNYSKLNIKSINIGTLKKPIEKIVVFNNENNSYVPIFSNLNYKTSLFYSQKKYKIELNGEILNYKTDYFVDQNNPYDPLFSSFDRLYSLPAQTFIRSGVTGLYLGEKQKFFNFSSGFNQTTNIEIKSAGRNLNGIFTPYGIVNGKTRYVNNSIIKPADIIWFENYSYTSGSSGFFSIITQSGWLLRQRQFRLSFDPFYFLSGNNLIPTGSNWTITGSLSPSGPNADISGINPVPTSNKITSEGFFKIATTRVSNKKNKIYAAPNGGTVNFGSTNSTLPLGYNWVTYPHSYNIQSYPAFRHDIFFSVENNTGVNDLLIISTGIEQKRIIYVSPHTVSQFKGFWSEESTVSINGDTLGNPIWLLNSGNLISVTSTNTSFQPLNSIFVSGSSGYFNLWNVEAAKLKQNIPLSQTNFYKLYEPLYQKNAFNTGTWNGIIPSGTPFSIETIRTKNSEIRSPKVLVYISKNFIEISGINTGNYRYYNTENIYYYGKGVFESNQIKYSSNSLYEANYLAENSSQKQAKSKLYGYLWEKGITKDNYKTRKITKLFDNKIYKYCIPNLDSSNPISCSYTGTNHGISGIKTNYGIRLMDQYSNFIPNAITETNEILKFEKIDTINNILWKSIEPSVYKTKNVSLRKTPVSIIIDASAYSNQFYLGGLTSGIISGINSYGYGVRQKDIIPKCFASNEWHTGINGKFASKLQFPFNCQSSGSGSGVGFNILENNCNFNNISGTYNSCGTFKWSVRRKNKFGSPYGPTFTPITGKTWSQCGITSGSWIIEVTWTPNKCAESLRDIRCPQINGFATTTSLGIPISVY